MSCYFRHMKDIFEEHGIEINKDNKRDIDRIIHKIVEIEYKDCPAAWKNIKDKIRSDKKTMARFIKILQKELG